MGRREGRMAALKILKKPVDGDVTVLQEYVAGRRLPLPILHMQVKYFEHEAECLEVTVDFANKYADSKTGKEDLAKLKNLNRRLVVQSS